LGSKDVGEGLEAIPKGRKDWERGLLKDLPNSLLTVITGLFPVWVSGSHNFYVLFKEGF